MGAVGHRSGAVCLSDSVQLYDATLLKQNLCPRILFILSESDPIPLLFSPVVAYFLLSRLIQGVCGSGFGVGRCVISNDWS